MNHWIEEELVRLTHAERQRKLEAERLPVDFSAREAHVPFTSRVALKLSDVLVASGESLRRRHEQAASASSWAKNRNFAR